MFYELAQVAEIKTKVLKVSKQYKNQLNEKIAV